MKSGDGILGQNTRLASSHQVAVAIAKSVPGALFCGFNVSTTHNKTTKKPMSLVGPGVGVDTPHEHLATASTVASQVEPPSKSDYWGLVMQKHPYVQDILGDDYALVILDLDTKNSTAPRDIRIDKLLKIAKEQGLMTERSHSLKGGHILLLCPADEAAPKKIKLGNSQEIEVFGLNNSAGKSVMLTGDKLRGDILPVDSLIDLLGQAGITRDVIFPPEPSAPSAPLEHTPLFPALKPHDELDRAQSALSHVTTAKGDYETWINMGMALQHGFGDAGFHPWVQWSASQPEFKGEDDCRLHWRSFTPDGRITLASLFHLARQHGYTSPTPKQERKTAVQDFGQYITSGETLKIESAPTHWPEIDLDLFKVQPVDYLIENFLAHSLMVVAGQPGVGKTTAMLSLAMVVSGFTLKDCSLGTEAPRRVVYVTEDVTQVQLSLFSYAKHHGIDPQRIKEMIHVVEARRSELPDILLLTENILQHTTTQGGHTLRPYLVLDTASATFDIEDENNNSEVAIYMEGIKQTLYTQLHTPIAIVTHTAKSLSTSDDTATARGASAWTGNATLTATLFIDQDERFMTLVKKRYQPLITELKFQTHINHEVTVSRHGNPQDVVCITVTPSESSKQERLQSVEDGRHERQSQRALDKADEACAYVQSVINSHPEGVVVRRGSSTTKAVPAELKGCYLLQWGDVYGHVPGSSRGDIKRSVSAAVFDRFAPQSPASGWVKLC